MLTAQAARFIYRKDHGLSGDEGDEQKIDEELKKAETSGNDQVPQEIMNQYWKVAGEVRKAKYVISIPSVAAFAAEEKGERTQEAKSDASANLTTRMQNVVTWVYEYMPPRFDKVPDHIQNAPGGVSVGTFRSTLVYDLLVEIYNRTADLRARLEARKHDLIACVTAYDFSEGQSDATNCLALTLQLKKLMDTTIAVLKKDASKGSSSDDASAGEAAAMKEQEEKAEQLATEMGGKLEDYRTTAKGARLGKGQRDSLGFAKLADEAHKAKIAEKRKGREKNVQQIVEEELKGEEEKGAAKKKKKAGEEEEDEEAKKKRKEEEEKEEAEAEAEQKKRRTKEFDLTVMGLETEKKLRCVDSAYLSVYQDLLMKQGTEKKVEVGKNDAGTESCFALCDIPKGSELMLGFSGKASQRASAEKIICMLDQTVSTTGCPPHYITPQTPTFGHEGEAWSMKTPEDENRAQFEVRFRCLEVELKTGEMNATEVKDNLSTLGEKKSAGKMTVSVPVLKKKRNVDIVEGDELFRTKSHLLDG